ncbi:Dps family protein [Arthrobacter monumenti]
MTATVNVKPAPTAAGVAQLLGPVVVELTALSVTGKQAHWHVKGPNFVPVHELLDTIVDNARAFADLAAERIVALGTPIDATLAAVAKQTAAPAFPTGFITTDTAVDEVVKHIDAALDKVRETVAPLGELDETSQDVAIEIVRGLDKDRWFLDSSRTV